MPLIITGLGAYLACKPETIPTSAEQYQGNTQNIDEAIIRTVAVYGVVFALAHCHQKNISFTPPVKKYNYHENLLRMAGIVNCESRSCATPQHISDELKLSSFRRFSTLNADHGMALSAFTALVTASSLTDPLSCVISSLSAAYGPLHFGATQSALSALAEVGNLENVPSFLEQVKSGKRKLFGYGHRSYRGGGDPRMPYVKDVLEDMRSFIDSNPLFKISQHIEKLASEDEYFLRRGLFPNADFYGHFIFSAM